ncbi:MAG: cache domain-containing protein [Cyanobacteria bacterium P01_E01_bin.42]
MVTNSSAPNKSLLQQAIASTFLPIVVAVSVMGYWSWQRERNAVTEFADELSQQINGRIEAHIKSYLVTSELFLKINALAARQNQLNVTDFESLQDHFWEQTQVRENVSTLYYGNETGDFVQVERGDPTTVTLRNPETTPLIEIYRLDDRGERQERLQTQEYDHRVRPWYRMAKEAGELIWSPIYVFTQPPILGISPAIPISDSEGNLQGVMAIDLTLSQLGEFLRDLEIGTSGEAFIIERSGDIVASSIGESPLKETPEGLERLSASASREPMIQAAVDRLQENEDWATLERDRHTIVDKEGDRYFVKIQAFQHEDKIDWLLGVIIPEADFQGKIAANTRMTLLVCFSAFILAALSSFVASRFLKN